MVYVDSWLHITGLISILIIFIISLQQICITSIVAEKPKSIYRIMTSIMAFTEFILHLTASLWYLSSSISDRNRFSILIHISRFMGNVLISVTFYPILIHTIQHFYSSREFKDELKIPKWLLSPWKYIILLTIICCIICYIITFITNSLSTLFIYYVIADIVILCACITLFVAMFDVYFKVKETALSLETRLEFNKQYEMEFNKQNTNSSENNHKIDVNEKNECISRANTLELEKAKNEINKGKYFIITCFIMITLVAIRAIYILYANIDEMQYYQQSTLQTMAFETVFSYLGSVLFVIVYDGGLLIWLWKSSKLCTDLDHDTMAYKIGCRYGKSFKLQRVNTTLKDEPNEKKQVKRRNKDNEKEKTIEIDIVTDELGHTVAEEYDDDEVTNHDEREQTDVVPKMMKLKTLETNDRILSQRPTVTSAPGGIGIVHQYSTDLDGLQLIKCKIIIYLFDLVIANCIPSIFYRKTAIQIQSMDEHKFIKQFGGTQRIQIIEKHILEMSKGAILYCITSKMNIKTFEAIMERLDLLKYFIGPIKKELIDHLNQITSINDRGISDNNNYEESPAPPPKISNIYIPSKLATLDEHKSAEHGDDIVTPSKDDNDEILENMNIPNRKYMSRSRSELKYNKPINIIKYHGDDITNDVKLFYHQRLFGKNTDIMKETKGNSQINLLIFKFLDYFDVLNDEILVITSDLQTTSYFKSIGLCKGYYVEGGNGLNDKDIEEIQKYL